MEKDVCKLSIHKMIICVLTLALDRVGSEFWNQQVRIGNDVTGIKWVANQFLKINVVICYDSSTTLMQSQKGLPPEFEFVGVPSMIRKEKGTMYTWIHSNMWGIKIIVVS